MRIYIIGTSGCGKSTLAKQLAIKLNYPHIELDYYRFLPNWQKRNQSEFINIIKEKINVVNWIVCGNETAELKYYLLNNTDKIIWLDYSFPLVFWRTTTRTLRRILSKECCCNGNSETLHQQFFSKHSIFYWIIKTFHQRRLEYQKLLLNPIFKIKILHINKAKAIYTLIQSLLPN